ncbi:MAG TPA: VOC family protein [Candidatus Baltobacteraceae bacterium]|nr:VOC family protein [Candidatus Baltobacteraceae bacterium]
MSKATGIDAVYYSVRDVARASAFYKTLLDVSETVWESEHGAEYVLADGTAFGIGKLAEHRASGCVLFAVPDLEALRGRVAQLGGTLDGEVRTLPVCVQQWCFDPDGNSFVLHQRTV